jgi:hypothetical protein
VFFRKGQALIRCGSSYTRSSSTPVPFDSNNSGARWRYAVAAARSRSASWFARHLDARLVMPEQFIGVLPFGP